MVLARFVDFKEAKDACEFLKQHLTGAKAAHLEPIMSTIFPGFDVETMKYFFQFEITDNNGIVQQFNISEEKFLEHLQRYISFQRESVADDTTDQQLFGLIGLKNERGAVILWFNPYQPHLSVKKISTEGKGKFAVLRDCKIELFQLKTGMKFTYLNVKSKYFVYVNLIYLFLFVFKLFATFSLEPK